MPDVVVANPPYVAEGSPDVDVAVREWEPHGALFAGPDGLDAIRLLVATAPGRVRPRGWLVLEIGADQGPAVERLLGDGGYRDVSIRPDLAGRDRVAVARLPSAGAREHVLRRDRFGPRPQGTWMVRSSVGPEGRRRQAQRDSRAERG